MRPRPQPALPRSALVPILVAAPLAALASAIGLLVPSFYGRDPEILQPQMLGQDLLTLLVAVPLLLASARSAARGSLLGYVATTAFTFYLAYAYMGYSFGTRFNALFPAYVAILGASTFALFALARHLPTDRVTPATWARLPRRALAGVFLGVAAVFALLWGADLVPALLQGTPPRAAVEFETPTSPIHVLDLAFLLPLGVVAAVLLLRRDPLGPLLAGVFLVKGATTGLAVLSMAAFSAAAGEPVNLPVAGAILAMLAALALVGVPTVRALRPAADAARSAGAAEAAG